MNVRPSILCPIDYSDASAGALHYAAAIAEHFVTRLIVLNVEDPLLTTAMDLATGVRWTREVSERELATFVSGVFDDDPAMMAMCEFDVAAGKPSIEILRVARERSCDLIVMGSHGLTGARKLLLGSTTERVLRETTVPVLVTPEANPGRVHIEDARRLLGRIVAPVDLSPASLHQTRVAAGAAEALGLPLVLLHVIEPVRSRLFSRAHLSRLDIGRQLTAKAGLDRLVAGLAPGARPETVVVHGDPADAAAHVVRDREAGLVVMGLRASTPGGPRMGSVTYRLLCQARALVLALPPSLAAPVERRAATSDVVAGAAIPVGRTH